MELQINNSQWTWTCGVTHTHRIESVCTDSPFFLFVNKTGLNFSFRWVFLGTIQKEHSSCIQRTFTTYLPVNLTVLLVLSQLEFTTEQYGSYLVWTQLTETHSPLEMVFKCTTGHPTGTRKDEIQWGHNGVHNYKSPRLQYHSHLYCITTHYKTPPRGRTSICTL